MASSLAPTHTPRSGEKVGPFPTKTAVLTVGEPSVWFEISPPYADANGLYVGSQLTATVKMHTSCSPPDSGRLLVRCDNDIMEVVEVRSGWYETVPTMLDSNRLALDIANPQPNIYNQMVSVCYIELCAKENDFPGFRVSLQDTQIETDSGEVVEIVGSSGALYAPGIFAERAGLSELSLRPRLVHAVPEQFLVTLSPYLSPHPLGPPVAKEVTATFVYDAGNMFLDSVIFDTEFWDLKTEFSEMVRGIVEIKTCRTGGGHDHFEEIADLRFQLTGPGVSRVVLQDTQIFTGER